jgi:hypothetical protein
MRLVEIATEPSDVARVLAELGLHPRAPRSATAHLAAPGLAPSARPGRRSRGHHARLTDTVCPAAAARE